MEEDLLWLCICLSQLVHREMKLVTSELIHKVTENDSQVTV
jgi:NTP pyrophosphatase (non-canonical NTP hydrolase)